MNTATATATTTLWTIANPHGPQTTDLESYDIEYIAGSASLDRVKHIVFEATPEQAQRLAADGWIVNPALDGYYADDTEGGIWVIDGTWFGEIVDLCPIERYEAPQWLVAPRPGSVDVAYALDLARDEAVIPLAGGCQGWGKYTVIVRVETDELNCDFLAEVR